MDTIRVCVGQHSVGSDLGLCLQRLTADNKILHWQAKTIMKKHINHQKPGRQTKQSNQLSLPHQDDCKTRMDIK